MTPLEKIREELCEIGFTPNVVSAEGFVQSSAVVIAYPVHTGRFKDQIYDIAIGFQEDSYPDYPPHFIYVAELPDPKLPAYSSFHYNNAKWSGFSVPPSDFWDTLPTSEKNMKTFVNRHMIRFWSQI